MLWIVEGKDISKKNKEIQKIKDKVAPDAVVRYETLHGDVSFLKDAQDLFGEKKLVIVSSAHFSEFEQDIAVYSVSPHYFIFCVEKLLAPERKKLDKIPIIDCVVPKQTKQEFNLFAFSDAFALKNKKNLWVLYQKAKREGVAEEQIIGILLWQIRIFLIVLHGQEKEASINPFVVGKAKKALPSFTQASLEGYMKDLVSMYHDARRGKNLENNFERFILSL